MFAKPVRLRFLLALSLCLVAQAGAENIVMNPGFEEHAGGKPAIWELFVQPSPAARGALSDTALTGNRSAMLETTAPYDRDPINNWSQNLYGSWGGATFSLSVGIKCENATEAAVWVQCWRRQPWSLLHTATTADAKLISGTQDWQQIAHVFTAPEETDFMTVRCLLRGTGTAWFDDIVLEGQAAVAGEKTESTVPPAAPPPEEKVAPSPTPAAGDAPAPVSEMAPAEAAGQIDVLEDTLREVRSTNNTLRETVEGMREENAALAEELQALRQQLVALQEQLRPKEPAEPESPRPPPPPLVPHGVDPEQFR